MKKKWLFIMVFISFVVVLFFVSSANDNPSGLYISTEVCPENYIQFAEENLPHFILAEDPTVELGAVSVGIPFSFYGGGSDVFYFPVMVDGIIEYLFRAYPGENGLCGAITRFLAEELEELASLTSLETPLKLCLIGSQIVGIVNNQEYVLYTYPQHLQLSASVVSSLRSPVEYTVVNSKQESGLQLNFVQSRDVYRYLYLDITETQGSNNWCAAYVTAAIVRTLTGDSVSAQGVMETFYRRPTSSDSLSRTNVIAYGQLKGFSPILIGDTVNQTFITEIENGRPVYWSMKRAIPGTDQHGYHAVVLCGYNFVYGSTWRIWNPWYDYYESFTMDGVYVPATASSTNYSYSYNAAIYNWQ
ncbi:MAG: hypothetical protein J6B86_04780 [Clostridia bacterium]|nr:hypothetical protein [Clostridia bacterium]